MKIWVADHNCVLQDIKKEFEVVERLEDADKVVLWNDVNPVERGIIRYAHALGKKVAVMQHGRKGTSKYYPPFNEEITADKLLVWGEFDRRSLIEVGRDAKKIQVVGTTVFSHLKPRKKHDGFNVVFCPEHWDRPVEENIWVRDALRKYKKGRKGVEKVNIITKIIESHDPKLFDNPVSSNRSDPNHLDICAEVLSTADVVVGVSESTFELLATRLNIPVVIMEEWVPKAFGGDMRYLTYRRVISEAAFKTSAKDIGQTINFATAGHPQYDADKRWKVCVEEGGADLNALNEIKKAIINL